MIASSLLVLLAVVSTPDEAGTWLNRAIEAHGGPGATAKARPLILRGALTSRMRDRDIEGSVVLYLEGEKARSESTIVMRGAPRDFISTWDGNESWSEFFGRKSENSVRPARSEAAHRPFPFLLAALAKDAHLVESVDADVVVIEVQDGEGNARLALDRGTARLRWIEYPYPHQQGLDELEVKTRRDSYDDWQPLADGVLYPRTWKVEIDSSPYRTMVFTEVEEPTDLDDQLFHMEEDAALALPSDELAE